MTISVAKNLQDVLSEGVGYKRSSRDTYLQRLRSRQLVTYPIISKRFAFNNPRDFTSAAELVRPL